MADRNKVGMINVLHIIERLEFGGAETLLLTFAKSVDRDKFNVIFCCLDEKGSIATMIARKGFKVVCLKAPRYIYSYKKVFRLAKLIRKEKIDIVHTHLHKANYIGRLIAYLTRVKIICKSEHGYSGDYRQQNIIVMPEYMKKNMLLDHITDAIIYVSEAQLRNSGNRVAPDRKHVIHNGVDAERFELRDDRGITRERLGLSDKDIVMGVVANLHTYKGHIYLLRALKELLLSYPSAKLLVIGKGPEEPTLKSAAEELGVEGNIIFLGCREDIPELIRCLDIMVLPSLFESFGIVLIEALCSKVPVIATNVGGIPEIVKDGETGILVPSQDPKALLNAMLSLIENPEVARKMSKRGREVALSKFSGQRHARDMERLYSSLVERSC